MPVRKYTRAQQAAYDKNQKRKRKAYANRQQKLSVQTVKDIAKEVLDEVVETKFYTLSEKTEIYYLGHPGLWDGDNHPWNPEDSQDPGRGTPFNSQIFSNASVSMGAQQGRRIGQKIFIKGFRLQMRLQSPPNVSHVHHHNDDYDPSAPDSCQWYEVHWMIYRQPRGLPSLESIKQLPNEDLVLRPLFNQERLRPVLKTVARGKYRFNPKVQAATTDDGTGAGSVFSRTSTVTSRLVDKYIPINKSFVLSDESTNRNPDPYFLLVWSRQDKQLISPTDTGGDGMYVGIYDNGTNECPEESGVSIPGNQRFNMCMYGMEIHMYYTDP